MIKALNSLWRWAPLLFCSTAFTTEVIPTESISNIQNALEEVKTACNAKKASCNTASSEVSGNPPCSIIADSGCMKLWNSSNDGFLESSFGLIQVGKSKKSGLSTAQRLDIEAWINSQPNLPKDLLEKIKPILQRLKLLLAYETNTMEWHQQMGTMLQLLKQTVDTVGGERAKAALPELNQTEDASISIEQRNKSLETLLDFQNQLIRAKYENHPNWKRVETAFKQAKNDLIATCQELSIPNSIKKKFLAKLKSIKLSLPFPDPRNISAPSTCTSTEQNAFYFPNANLFTVCAGMFNTFQSEPNLYSVIAHELSHAIDPEVFIQDDYKQSPIGQVIEKLSSSKKPPFSCDEWQQLRDGTLAPIKEIIEPLNPYTKLTDCLAPPLEPLRPFNSKNINPISKRYAATAINQYANANIFSLLVQAKTTNIDKVSDNEFYMRPDRAQALMTGGLINPQKNYLSAIPATFTQSLTCQQAEQDGKKVDFEHATGKIRQDMFEKAIFESREIQQIVYESIFSRCGKECAGLVGEDLSRNAQENFADWMASQALPHYLKREKSLEKRRELLSIATLSHCNENPNAKMIDTDLNEIEKKFSFDRHPDNRIRRLSFFTPEVAKTVGCEIDNEIKRGFGECSF